MTRDLETVRRGLAAYLPDGARVTEVRPLAAGFSNETYVIEGLDLILRLPPAGEALLDSHGVTAQADIYRALANTPKGPAVPTVLVSCEDRSVLGDPFFVMERMAGQSVQEYAPDPWFSEGSVALRDSMCRQWIGAIANLARLAPLEALGAPRSPEDEARQWRAMAARAGRPDLVAAFDQLLATPAPRSGPPAVAHGDPKIANMLWNDGELSAVLDWEMSYNGEPLGDLGYLLYFFDSEAHPGSTVMRLPGMWNRDQIIQAWSDVSGRPAAGHAWYEVAGIGTIAAIMAHGYHLFATGKSTDARFDYFRGGVDRDTAAMIAKMNTDPWFCEPEARRPLNA